MRKLLATLFLILLVLAIAGEGILYPPTAEAAPLACTELVQNGGFEAGAASWEIKTNGPGLIGSTLPHTGQLGALLGGRNNANDELGQGLTLPAGQTSILRFWWHMLTTETSHPADHLDIQVRLADRTVIPLQQITDGSVAGSWQQGTLDLTAYAGQSVDLQFNADTDAARPTYFYLDDVSVQACTGATGTSTATPSPTATVTPGPTHTPTVTATLSSTPDDTGTPEPTHTPTVTPTGTRTTPTATRSARIYLPLLFR